MLLTAALSGCFTAPQKNLQASTNPAESEARALAGDQWNRRLAASVLPNVDYPANGPKPPRSAEFTVFMNSDGAITDKALLNTSGNFEWDRAASLALRKAGRLPVIENSRAPYQIVLAIAPTYVTGAVIQPFHEPAARHVTSNPAATYADRVAAAVRPNVVYPKPEEIPGNPGVEFDVSLAGDGQIVAIALSKSSGWLDWDAAALRALRKTERLPQDIDGKVPRRLILTLRPKR
ncbi:outer membrane biosynthesis protein TonB [Variovorax paradoxus]|uniref:TonB C-terminal domain-containing protein n=1 Tax=Variovorax paradoxus TaxID=34073 RepID=UPI00278B2AE2|nr:TonB C-terminal domain-containing protein [Variovorax paradoxus]MDQ0028133.1 outer membrane biosynthesis protein TonB [Variovorax paradoxus]